MRQRLLAMLAVYTQIWLVDTEYYARPGARVRGICICAIELRSGVRFSRWVWARDPGLCPWNPDDPKVLIICFSAVAECSFFLSCGWRLPKSILDLLIAYRVLTNGRVMLSRTRLLRVLEAEGIPHPVDDDEKAANRQLCKDGGPSLERHECRLISYCMSDTEPLEPLLDKTLPRINLDQIIEFSKYAAHIAQVEYRGIPIDVPRLQLISDRWEEIQKLAAVRANGKLRFEIFGGPGRHLTSLSPAAAEEWLRRVGLLDDGWPLTDSGQPSLKKKTLKRLEGRHPDLVHLRQGRAITTGRHPQHINIGDDGRCRISFMPLGAITSRNLPKSDWPLAYASPLRALIVPPHPWAIVIIDVDQADPGTAAALSGDANMMHDYFEPQDSPDFYLSFAVGTRAVNSRDDSRAKQVRDLYKTACCAIMYGTGADNLSDLLGVPFDVAKSIIRRHKHRYSDYWSWVQGNVGLAAARRVLTTASGWAVHNVPPTLAMCFPVQAAGADVLRLASLRMEAAGIPIVWPNHDSVAAMVPGVNVLDAARDMVRIWGDASEEILDIRHRVSVQIVSSGERYLKDEKAAKWWREMSEQLGEDP